MSIYLVVYDTLPAVCFLIILLNLKAPPYNQPLLTQTNLPYIAFVARKTIEAGTELTVDYDPISADLQDPEQSPRDTKGMKKCNCGSQKCRGYVQMC